MSTTKAIIKDYMRSIRCEQHNFIPVTWSVSEGKKATAMVMCTHCLRLMNFKDIAESFAEYFLEAGVPRYLEQQERERRARENSFESEL